MSDSINLSIYLSYKQIFKELSIFFMTLTVKVGII